MVRSMRAFIAGDIVAADTLSDAAIRQFLLTPGQDPFSMLLLAIPMILLYELGILLIGRRKKTSVAVP